MMVSSAGGAQLPLSKESKSKFVVDMVSHPRMAYRTRMLLVTLPKMGYH